MENKPIKILAIETSCDETAAAVVEKDGQNVRILSNIIASQIEIHKKFGGVFPEHASRAHCERIIPVVEESLSETHATQSKSRRRDARLKSSRLQACGLRTDFHAGEIEAGIFDVAAPSDFDLIAVTTGPGLIGSLLVGVNFAKTYAYAKNLPIIGINHWLGHIYSCFVGESSNLKTQMSKQMPEGMPLSKPGARSVAEVGLSREGKRRARLDREGGDEGATRGLPTFPALILIVSGGHTGLVLMKSHNNMITLGETLDDAAGEAFDKVAKLLEFGYPGGPAISKAVEKYQNHQQKSHFNRDCVYGGFLENDIKLPRSMLDRENFDFSFSGLKTAVLYEVKKLAKRYTLNAIRYPMAASFQQAVIDILIGKTIQAAYKYHPKSICLCGGVSANKELRKQLKKAVSGLPWNCSYHIPPMDLTTDNAAMIGIAAAYHLDKITNCQNINADANLSL